MKFEVVYRNEFEAFDHEEARTKAFLDIEKYKNEEHVLQVYKINCVYRKQMEKDL